MTEQGTTYKIVITHTHTHTRNKFKVVYIANYVLLWHIGALLLGDFRWRLLW